MELGMSKPKRYQVVMSNSAGTLDQSDGVDTLSEAKGALMRMVERVYEVSGGDTFTVVDREPDKEPVYE
jgi:hypothetical protein